MDEIMLLSIILVPVVTAVVQVVKGAINIPNGIIPLVAVIIGILIGIGATPIEAFADISLNVRIWVGAIAGLAAVGFFEVGHKRTGGSKDKDEYTGFDDGMQ